MVLPYIFKYGTQDQLDQFIKPMINGETIGAIGTFLKHSNLLSLIYRSYVLHVKFYTCACLYIE